MEVLQKFLDQAAVAVLPVAQLNELHVESQVKLDVEPGPIFKLNVDFVSLRIIGQNDALHDLAGDVFDKGMGHLSSWLDE